VELFVAKGRSQDFLRRRANIFYRENGSDFLEKCLEVPDFRTLEKKSDFLSEKN